MAEDAAITTRVNALERGQAAHEAGCSERWNNQHKFNDFIDTQVTRIHLKIDQLDEATDDRLRVLEGTSQFRGGMIMLAGGLLGSVIFPIALELLKLLN